MTKRRLVRFGIATMVALAAPALVTLLHFTSLRAVVPGLLYIVAIIAATAVGGCGLGLYISRELVSRMGGRMSVRSRPGEGAAFTVELPAA